jgi:hypothetical protein
MLVRGKYDALTNVTWDCFDQSNFYISRINIIEWNNIQLLPALKVNIRIAHPRGVVFPRALAPWKRTSQG